MPKKSDLPLKKSTLNFFEGDVEALGDFYPRVGWSVAARQIIHVHVKRLREKHSRSGAILNERADIAELAASIDLGDVLASVDETGDGPDDGDLRATGNHAVDLD